MMQMMMGINILDMRSLPSQWQAYIINRHEYVPLGTLPKSKIVIDQNHILSIFVNIYD